MKASEIVERLEVEMGVRATAKGRQRNRKLNRQRGFVVFIGHGDRDRATLVRRLVSDLLLFRNITGEVEVVVDDPPETTEAEELVTEPQLVH